MPSDETQFKPGQSGNPSGRPKLPEDIKKARRMNQIEVERTINKFMRMTKDEIAHVVNAPGTPAIEVMIGSIIAKAVGQGDHMRLNFLLDRLIGPVKKEVDVSVMPKPYIIERLDGSQVELGMRDVEAIDESEDSE